MNPCAVILGGYINGYAIINELHSQGVRDIALLTYHRQLAFYSNKTKAKSIISKTKEDLLEKLQDLKKEYDLLVLFPTDDWFVEQLALLEPIIASFTFIPFNAQTVQHCSNKFVQYDFCNQSGIPFPKTTLLDNAAGFHDIEKLAFPIIIKPVIRNDLMFDVFRSKRFYTSGEFENFKPDLTKYLQNGYEFIVSEIIPGTSSGNIYAYCAYADKQGNILNEWGGRKLSQYPDDYGIFSSASNEVPDTVMQQGRDLVKSMGLYGFCEPEFKFDERDGKYKLMEVNLRSMMWNELGTRSGVLLHYTQWCYATGAEVPVYKQESRLTVLIYYKHEILNLLSRKKYWSTFKKILSHKNKYWSGIYKGDLSPFFNDMISTTKSIISTLFKKRNA
ncbi:MAG: hypothetical protein QM802_08955 [Agriterribacter sp.]